MATVGMMAYPIRESFQGYPHQYPMYHPTRAHQPHLDVATSLNANPYTSFSNASQLQQAQHLSRSTQSSGSPVSEDGSRPSLPSISNLLGIADGDRTDQDNSQQSQQSPSHVQSQPVQIRQRQQPAYPPQELASSQRTIIPPTPPLRNDSVVEGTQSPSTISTGSSISAQPYYIGSSLNNVDADHQRAVHAQFIKRHSAPSQPNTSPYGTSPYNTSPYTSSPGALSNGSYYSPTEGSYPSSSIYHQRPLPSNFPPPPPPAPPAPPAAQSTPNLPSGNPWEHHHYISPSSQATFPQSQDRYICQTCNKAFSRPSSLKIHSHSHTGEKPFKCPHAGCGKAFSVRSNMKRHERGCHTGVGGMGAPAAHMS